MVNTMRLKQNILYFSFIFIFTFTSNAQNNIQVEQIAKNIAYISAPSLYEVDYSKLSMSLKQVSNDTIKYDNRIKAFQVIDILSKKEVFNAFKGNGDFIYGKKFPQNIDSQYSKLIVDSTFDNEIVGKIVVFYDIESKISLAPKEIEYLKNKKLIRICSKSDKAPIEFIGKTGEMEGVVKDNMNLLGSKIGHNIKFTNINTDSWLQTQEYLQDNKCDIVSMPYIEEREKFGNFTKPYMDLKLVIITRTSEPFSLDRDDVLHKGIAQKRNCGLIKKLRNIYPDAKIIETENYDDTFLKVSSGEVYSTISNILMASYYIKKYGLTNLKITGDFDNKVEPLSILVRKDDAVLHGILNKAINGISEAEQNKILKEYTSVQFDKKVDYSLLWKVLIVFLVIVILFVYRQIELKKLNKDLEKK